VSEDILDLIDGAIDAATGAHGERVGDAMRWRPDLAREDAARDELAARYARHLEYAAARMVPVRLAEQRPARGQREAGEALTTDSTPPARVVGDGIPDVLHYRRHCPNCATRTAPRYGVIARIPDLAIAIAYEPADPTASLPLQHDTAHVCGSCHGPYPAPALWGSVKPVTYPPRAYELELRDDTRWARNWVSAELVEQAVADVNALVWEELERALAEQRLPTCVNPGCEAKARCVFTVEWRNAGAAIVSAIAAHIGNPELEPAGMWLCGRPWAPGDRIDLCPEHAHHVYRGEDPANPGRLRDDLVPDLWAPR